MGVAEAVAELRSALSVTAYRHRGRTSVSDVGRVYRLPKSAG